MKKSLALVLALVMVLSSFSFVSAAPDFADVKGTMYEEPVARLELLSVLKGYPDGSFKPEGSITRAEFAAVAVRVKGLAAVAEASKGLPSGFSDVPVGHWAAGYVGVAGSTGIVKGIGGGLFAPNAPVKYEEAVTMLVRALGYEQDALSKGGYPFGYLIVAKEIDLLDDVIGTMGLPATRGLVAMLTDNALEIPMMIQVGFGADTKWVVSGTQDTKEVFLLDYMGLSAFEGRVVDFDSEDLTIVLEDETGDYDWSSDQKEFEVKEGFDFFAANMVTIKAWVDGDEVVASTLLDTVKYDATTITDVDANKIKLVTEGKTYTLDLIEGSRGAYNFAKVVFDGSKVVAIVDYDLDGFIVVDDVEDDIITALNDEELDIEDFTVVKDGKTIGSTGLVKGDVVFYDESEELAVVYNNTVVGEIERVYSPLEDGFRLGGKVYKPGTDFEVLYLDGTTLDVLTLDELEAMMDEGEDVKVFFDFNKKVVLVSGETGDVATSSFYAVLTANTNMWTSRSGAMWSLDVFTEKGAEVAYDLDQDFITDEIVDDGLGMLTTAWEAAAVKGALARITVDTDGEVTNVVFKTATSAGPFDIEDTYVGTNRLMANTVVFYDFDGLVPEKVIAFGDIEDEFFDIEEAQVLAEEGRVKVVLATATDADTDSTSVTGLITNVRLLRTEYVEFTIEVAGVEKIYTTEGKVTSGFATYDAMENHIGKVMVGDVSGKLVKFDIVPGEGETMDYVQILMPEGPFEVDSRSTIDKTITVYDGGERVFELLSTTVIYDGDWEIISLRQITDSDVVSVIFDGNSTRFVKFVIVEAVK